MHAPRPQFLGLSSVQFAAGFLGCMGAAQVANAQWTVTNLHPAGAEASSVTALDGQRQIGVVAVGGSDRAGMWSGTAGSWVSLHPSGAIASSARGGSSVQQVGSALIGTNRASLWSGSAASWVNLSPIGATFAASECKASDGAQQVGWVQFGNGAHATLWSGTAESRIDLNPPGSRLSVAYAVGGGQQGGFVEVGGVVGTSRASIWSGTAASWVDLTPPGASVAVVLGIGGGRQVGTALIGPINSASLWTGTAASWVDLNPAGADDSSANAARGAFQVGYARLNGQNHAGVWSGTAASWVDLSAFLPAGFESSEAKAIFVGDDLIFVAGSGANSVTGRTEALSWTRPLCPADFNHSGGPTPLSVQDIFDFLNAWFSADPAADFNGNGLSVSDIFDFLNAWFAGC